METHSFKSSSLLGLEVDFKFCNLNKNAFFGKSYLVNPIPIKQAYSSSSIYRRDQYAEKKTRDI